eukprot:TRINITY_DN11167_c0_g1_i1.p1 TRINITY_DN11167_c0_g1~~TRINITY_DN11167_c0_g1_i1.p1  ORF type:complete len:145 (-),score=27.34 TRINITY_DN11167_c0_g1_i1:34-411(-)
MCIRDRSITRHPSLLNLTLDVGGCQSFRVEGCKSVGRLVNHFSTTLKNLHLNFKSTNINDEALKNLGDVIRKCSNVTDLILNFEGLPDRNGSNKSDRGVGDITHGLSSLTPVSYTHLTLPTIYSV